MYINAVFTSVCNPIIVIFSIYVVLIVNIQNKIIWINGCNIRNKTKMSLSFNDAIRDKIIYTKGVITMKMTVFKKQICG